MNNNLKAVDLSICHRLLYPSIPVMVVSSTKDKTSAMLAVSVIVISNAPPLLGISISPHHTTYRTIRSSKSFTISLFDAKSIPLLKILARKQGYKRKDKLSESGFHKEITPKLKTIAPKEAIAILECKVLRDLRVGDHRFLISRIISATASNDFKGYWRYKDYNPILYIGSTTGFLFCKVFRTEKIGFLTKSFIQSR
jgi:flavin reductase (DIM6/NTAB) family NADH-FMN oxidoreductase RutF